jgi:hypothetical protein
MPFYASFAGFRSIPRLFYFKDDVHIDGSLPSAVYFYYPKVKYMTLEDIREVLNHGFGVKYA